MCENINHIYIFLWIIFFFNSIVFFVVLVSIFTKLYTASFVDYYIKLNFIVLYSSLFLFVVLFLLFLFL